jgi:3-oxoacyl-[acyl-carrier-protein] synthase II
MTVLTGVGWVTDAGMGMGRGRHVFETTPGELPPITRKQVFDEPYPHFGRMDDLSRLGLAAIGFALKDAGLADWTTYRDIGIVAVSVCGCLRTDMDYYDTVMPEDGLLASPALFSYTLPNCFLGEAAVCFGLTGTGYVINEAAPSGMASLCAGLETIADGESDTMICGACDLKCPSGIPREGTGPAGAVFFVLETLPRSRPSPYGDLRLDNGGTVSFNGNRIHTLIQLARACRVPVPQ